MLRKAADLHNFELRARDGVLGKVKDFYFDDEHWTVRYLVVETGSWLDSRKVLIATEALDGADWEHSLIPVALTQDQVRNSPGIDTEEPVSRDQQSGLHAYYGWPAYWLGGGYLGGGVGMPVPDAVGVIGPGSGVAVAIPPGTTPLARTAPDGDPRLRSGRAVAGYNIEATDGAIGHVEDYLIDDQSWNVRFVVIDTRNWLPGRKVIISPDWISEVNWVQSRVYVDLPRERIKEAPEYDAAKPFASEYAERLHAHYDSVNRRG